MSPRKETKRPTPARTTKCTVVLPPLVVRNLDVYSAQAGICRSEIVERALEQYLGRFGVRIYEEPKISWG